MKDPRSLLAVAHTLLGRDWHGQLTWRMSRVREIERHEQALRMALERLLDGIAREGEVEAVIGRIRGALDHLEAEVGAIQMVITKAGSNSRSEPT